jgi:hypothetical protein
MSHRIWALLSTVAATTLLASAAFADDQAPAAAAPAAPAAPVSWMSGIKFSGHIEAGATMNPTSPSTGVNFGHLFTDKANQIVLNQAAITIERDPDPKATSIDIGFKIQGIYGSDSRYTHFIGELDNQTSMRNQFDIIEANLQAHIPVFTPGGIDVKIGQFSTPIGNEVIDPTGNFFYSKSYIFNFGIPLKHTGILTTTHVNSILDIYAGYTTGVNTSLGSGGGYNDGQFHFLGGIGLNFKNVTVLALTHIGPENPGPVEGVDIHGQLRYLSDIVVTWKVNDKLTSVTELNYIRDEAAGGVAGGGVAEYLTYPLTSTVMAGVRGEIWRDANGFFVAAFPGNNDFVNFEKTGAVGSSYGGGIATYGAITLGLNIKPAHLPKMIDGLNIRPELRYDRTLSGGGAFFGADNIVGKDQVTIGLDVVIPLTF